MVDHRDMEVAPPTPRTAIAQRYPRGVRDVQGHPTDLRDAGLRLSRDDQEGDRCAVDKGTYPIKERERWSGAGFPND